MTSLPQKNDSDFEIIPETSNDSSDETDDCVKCQVTLDECDNRSADPGPSGMQSSANTQ